MVSKDWVGISSIACLSTIRKLSPNILRLSRESRACVALRESKYSTMYPITNNSDEAPVRRVLAGHSMHPSRA